MVLDYLETQRDAPDQELLDRMQWSDDDMRQFLDRWKKVRQSDSVEPGGPSAGRDVEDALRSLGLRPPGRATRRSQDGGDGTRGLRDAGNRNPAPPAFRDAFDAFRRGVGQE